jgi:hypothetical protein
MGKAGRAVRDELEDMDASRYVLSSLMNSRKRVQEQGAMRPVGQQMMVGAQEHPQQHMQHGSVGAETRKSNQNICRPESPEPAFRTLNHDPETVKTSKPRP